MRNLRLAIAAASAVVALVGEASASGVGAALYVPGKIQPAAARQAPVKQTAVQQASFQTCGPNEPCHEAHRLGFAGVDPATPAPCTAEGGCKPAPGSFGFYNTRWRRWPGARGPEGPSPELAEESEDSLLPAFDPPSAEEEDQRAPPPIDEAEEPEAEAADTFEDRPTVRPRLDIDLPPLPERGPDPARPAPNRLREGPPELPFGFAPEPRSPRTKATGVEGNQWTAPAPPFGTQPKGFTRAGSRPPAPSLPKGLGQARRTTRYGAAVRPVVALQQLPQRR